MGLIVAIAAVFAMLAMPACTSRPTPQAPRTGGWLHTEGRRILDWRGRSIRLLGTGIANLNGGSGYPNPQAARVTGCTGWTRFDPAVAAAVAAMGFNSVRVGIAWANIEPRPPLVLPDGRVVHTYDQAYLRELDGEVRAFGAHGVAVILEMAQFGWSPAFKHIPTGSGYNCQGLGFPTWLYPNAASITPAIAKCDFFADRPEPGVDVGDIQARYLDVWRAVAGRYAHTPAVVGLDLVNEPYSAKPCTAGQLRLGALYGKLGSAVRAANPRALLVFQDSQDRGDGVFALAGLPPFDNEVYEFHLYTANWNPDGLARTRAFMSRARRWRVPLWIGEFNRFGPRSDPPPDWIAQFERMFAYCRRHDIGWDYWSFGGPDLPLMRGGKPSQPIVGALQGGF